MNTTNRPRTAIALTVTVAAVTLLLAGCTPNPTTTPTLTSSATPTPTPATDPQPESEPEAIDAAELVIDDYLYIRGQVNANGGKDTRPLETVAGGNALRLALDDAGRVVDGELRTEGQISFDPTDAYATTLEGEGVSIPFGSVNVTGCQDGSSYKIFNADGTPAQQPEVQRNLFEFNAIWEPTKELWLVSNVVYLDETC